MVTATDIYLIDAFLILILFYILVLIIRRKYPRFWFIFQVNVLRKKHLAEKIVKGEEEESKKYKYETFEDFLRDCPKYQIETGVLGQMYRKTLKSFGARFQQFVFIDKTSPEDKRAWLRKKDNLVLHEKGTYSLPWKSEKEIVYYDITDMRPLIDLTDEMDWKNQDAIADVVTAITNSHAMASMDGSKSQLSLYIIIILFAVVISAVLIVVLISDVHDNNTQTIEMLKIIANQTATHT